MPQAVIPALAAVFGATAAVAVWTAFTYIAAGFLLNKAMAALQKKPKRGHLSLEVNFAGTIEPRRIIFGTIKVGGMHNIPPINSGGDNQLGHADIIHAGHEVADIRDVWLDLDKINDADIGAIASADTSGQVTTGKYANHVNIRRHLGTSTQTVDYILNQAFPAAFTADFRLRGIAHTALRCKYNSKIFTSWPVLTALVDGYKVYDPRLDTTKPGGSGSHREDDPTTWAFSSNPALILRHFLVWEIGFSHAEAGYNQDSLIMAAANVCDVAVDIPGSLTQKRFTFNAQLIATDRWEDNLRAIVDSMLGHCAYVDGNWHIYAGSWQTPDVTINPGDWVAPTTVQATANRDERWNFVRGWYVDPDRNWQRVECYPRRNSSYETADGGERIPLEVEMPHCASSIGTKYAEYEAQRRCEVLLRKSRNQIKMAGKLRPAFAKLIPGNTVYVNDPTYGFADKSFRIIAVESGIGPEDGGVDVALIEEGALTWTDLAAGEYNTETVGSALDPSATLPSLTANPVITVGRETIQFDVTSAVPTHQPQGTEYVIYQNPSSNFPPGAEIHRGQSLTPVVARNQVNTFHYWMRAEIGTYASAYVPNTVGIPVGPLPQPDEFVLDPDFSRSTSTNSLWNMGPGSVNSATLIMSGTIVASGGYAGSGRFLFTHANTNASIRLWPGMQPHPPYNDESFELLVRWRRTSVTSIVPSQSVITPQCSLTSSIYTWPDALFGLNGGNTLLPTIVAGQATVLGSDINTAPSSVWQETRTVFRIPSVNSGYSSIVYKHAFFGWTFLCNSYASNPLPVIEIDQLSVSRLSQYQASTAPQTSVTAAYVASKLDVGGHLKTTTGGITINAGVFDVGDLMAYFNNSGSTQNLTAGAGVTFRLAGTSTTGSPRTIAVYGIISVLCVDTDTFLITGNIS